MWDHGVISHVIETARRWASLKGKACATPCPD